MRLLEHGYTARTIVHDPTNQKKVKHLLDLPKVKHLLDLPKAKTHLTIWKADLANEGTFDEAIQGCSGVFHVATPMDFESKDPEQHRDRKGELTISGLGLGSPRRYKNGEFKGQ
ncbi:hypothetical protein C1H46_020931 [Malus baccata]|uniref:3-beta hydroxysteroid dehydrogenase/isomerase domain-containing protein n=1 Tax=Malus baccata TaxID=106549 RepID=A0A540M3Z4_MALBA|nr:hypothetical protein C1H46_020931 [Malus baccata]